MRSRNSKTIDINNLLALRGEWRGTRQKMVFTNGCFDIMHLGHLDYLEFAREQGDLLVVGVNSDNSVKRNKGVNRPVFTQDRRAAMLAGLECVDYVIVFEEDEPAGLIAKIIPDVLVKGEDWSHYVSGRETVEANGGRVVLAPLIPGLSTSNIIKMIKEMD